MQPVIASQTHLILQPLSLHDFSPTSTSHPASVAWWGFETWRWEQVFRLRIDCERDLSRRMPAHAALLSESYHCALSALQFLWSKALFKSMLFLISHPCFQTAPWSANLPVILFDYCYSPLKKSTSFSSVSPSQPVLGFNLAPRSLLLHPELSLDPSHFWLF